MRFLEIPYNVLADPETASRLTQTSLSVLLARLGKLE
jgi:hypothetical protein